MIGAQKHMGTLRYNISILFIKFYSMNAGSIGIHGCLGATSYIDKVLTKDDAKKYWKKKVSEGWHKCDNNGAPIRDWWFWN